ncbi:ComEA family DNA-binding protein [Thiomicrorhabdus arctica]|uniref:ComEA family DNA-binding protein n=1 Tax=Thiomicrorhabdus arctica TaxID=131540 RepID=UPI00037EFA83|nr:helix-hairpin-helix domain-containing protein [Thiomicrorhabdus arctica]
MLLKTGLLIALLSFSASVLSSPVNVNTGSAEEISSALKGIGPTKAVAISKLCQATPCTKPEDLLQVKGIGEKTLEKIKMDLVFKTAK